MTLNFIESSMHAILERALEDCSLKEALRYSNLEGVRLMWANLKDANLTG